MKTTKSVPNEYISGKLVFMPAHPEADENGYVDIGRPGFITELVQMIILARKDYINQFSQFYKIPINKV